MVRDYLFHLFKSASASSLPAVCPCSELQECRKVNSCNWTEVPLRCLWHHLTSAYSWVCSTSTVITSYINCHVTSRKLKSSYGSTSPLRAADGGSGFIPQHKTPTHYPNLWACDRRKGQSAIYWRKINVISSHVSRGIISISLTAAEQFLCLSTVP